MQAEIKRRLWAEGINPGVEILREVGNRRFPVGADVFQAAFDLGEVGLRSQAVVVCLIEDPKRILRPSRPTARSIPKRLSPSLGVEP